MRSANAAGRVILGLALLGFGVENILFSRYIVARIAPWPPDDRSAQMLVGFTTAAVFVASGIAFLTGRFVRPAGLASAALILGYSMVLHWPVAFAGPAWSGHWTNVLKAATLAAGALGVALADGRSIRSLLSALRALAPYVAGAFFLLAGIQHFKFADVVATLVPPFIPWARFWTYVAAVALLAAGVGFCTPRFRRVAALLTSAMVFLWVFLVHVPLVFRGGSRGMDGGVRGARHQRRVPGARPVAWPRARIRSPAARPGVIAFRMGVGFPGSVPSSMQGR